MASPSLDLAAEDFRVHRRGVATPAGRHDATLDLVSHLVENQRGLLDHAATTGGLDHPFSRKVGGGRRGYKSAKHSAPNQCSHGPDLSEISHLTGAISPSPSQLRGHSASEEVCPRPSLPRSGESYRRFLRRPEPAWTQLRCQHPRPRPPLCMCWVPGTATRNSSTYLHPGRSTLRRSALRWRP